MDKAGKSIGRYPKRPLCLPASEPMRAKRQQRRPKRQLPKSTEIYSKSPPKQRESKHKTVLGGRGENFSVSLFREGAKKKRGAEAPLLKRNRSFVLVAERFARGTAAYGAVVYNQRQVTHRQVPCAHIRDECESMRVLEVADRDDVSAEARRYDRRQVSVDRAGGYVRCDEIGRRRS